MGNSVSLNNSPSSLSPATHFGPKTAAQIIREAVLELTYTAATWPLSPATLGYAGDPFVWNDDRRLQLRAKLDAVFFHLYGVTARDDIRYIYSTFPIVKRKKPPPTPRPLLRPLPRLYERPCCGSTGPTFLYDKPSWLALNRRRSQPGHSRESGNPVH